MLVLLYYVAGARASLIASPRLAPTGAALVPFPKGDAVEWRDPNAGGFLRRFRYDAAHDPGAPEACGWMRDDKGRVTVFAAGGVEARRGVERDASRACGLDARRGGADYAASPRVEEMPTNHAASTRGEESNVLPRRASR